MTDKPTYGFFTYLRRLERRSPDKPRIGRNHTQRQEVAKFGQDPNLAFPAQDFSDVEDGATPSVRVNFLGFFGPQGALPLNTTEEVARWVQYGDRAFVKFTDIFASRFLQLFFRAWSDARAITQFDHPGDDRFQKYVGALSGVATESFRARDRLDQTTRLQLVALHAGRVKSPVKLRQMLSSALGVSAKVVEHVPSWMVFEPSSQNALGGNAATLGRDCHLGSRVQTIGEKIRIELQIPTMSEYRRFLPGGPDHAMLSDLVFWYLGKRFEVDVTLLLPANQIVAAKLGQSTELGWMACMAPAKTTQNSPEYIETTRYTLSSDQSLDAEKELAA